MKTPNTKGYRVAGLADLRCSLRHRDGTVSVVEVMMPVEPSAWSADDAKQVLWDLIRQLDAHGVYRIDIRQVTSPVEWAIEVQADTGEIVTQPLALSGAATVWLASCRFALPGSRGVQ